MSINLVYWFWISFLTDGPVLIPINSEQRSDIQAIQLTSIGRFGLPRKARPGIPGHLHTGIDIRRPTENYDDEPIYPIATGIVISKRTDGPYAQLIVEHSINGLRFWTLYEHIAGITVELYEETDPQQPMARFMNSAELDQYGWQFDHFHFEVLKAPPEKIHPHANTPDRHFRSYTLSCFNQDDLSTRFYDPLKFLQKWL